MSADDDKKQPGEPGNEQEGTPFLADAADDDWDAAIDEWDALLDFPETAEQSLPDASAAASAAEQDPLVNLLGGEMELPEGDGQALGALLGTASTASSPSAAVEPGGGGSMPPVAAEPDPLEGLAIDPVPVPTSEVELELTGDNWQAAARREAVEVEREQTSVRTDGWSDAETPPIATPLSELEPVTRVVPPAGAEEDEQSVGGLEFEALVGELDAGDGLDDPTLRETAPRDPGQPLDTSTRATAQVPVPDLSQLIPEGGIASQPPAQSPTGAADPLPLEVFDEIVPPSQREPYDEIEAGDVLPAQPRAKQPAAAAVTEASRIPQDLSLTEEDRPSLHVPELPQELRQLDLSQLALPQQLDPVAPMADYQERLVELLQSEAQRCESTAHAAEMTYMAASTVESTGDQERALDLYQEVLQVQPGHLSTLRELRRLFTERGEDDRVAETLEEIARRTSGGEREAVEAARAELLWSRTGDDEGARRIAEGHGSSQLRAMVLQADLAAASGDNDELDRVLQRLGGALEGDTSLREGLQVERARLLEAQGDVRQARELYQAVSDCPAATLGTLRTSGALDDHGAVVAALDSLARESGPWSARLLRQAAVVARLRRVDDASPIELAQRAAEMAPQDATVTQTLAVELLRQGDAASAMEALGRLAELESDSGNRGLALADAAQVAEERLGDVVRALELYQRAAEVLPDSATARDLAARARSMAGDAELRLEAHQQAAVGLEGGARSARHLAAARILEQELQRADDAAAELVQALEHDPHNRVAIHALQRLYREADQLERLAAVFDTAAEAAETPSTCLDLRLRAAALYEGPLGNQQAAVTRYRQVLEQEPEQTAARLGLERALSALNERRELAELLARDAARSEDPIRAAQLLVARGRLLEADPLACSASFTQALDRAPGFDPALLALTVQAAKEGDWSAVANLWRDQLDVLPLERPQRGALLIRLAALQERVLDDREAALAVLEQACAGEAPPPGAAAELVRVASGASDPGRQASALEQLAAQRPAGRERAALLVSAAREVLRSGAPWATAETLLRRAMESPDGGRVAQQTLEQLYLDNDAWEPLSDLIMEELKAEDAPAERRIRSYERLALLDRLRGDPESARLSYELVLDLSPGHLTALRFLQRQLLRREEPDALARLLAHEARADGESDDAPALWTALGHLLSLHPPAAPVGGEAGAAEQEEQAQDLVPSEEQAYGRAAELNPSTVIALRRLLELALLKEDRAAAGELYARLADAVRDDARQVALLLVRAAELNDDDLATYQSALEHSPGLLPAAHRMLTVALQQEHWDAACRAAEAASSASAVQSHRVELGLLAGEIAQIHLQDQQRAAESFRRVLTDAPGCQLAFDGLRQHLEQQSQWTELVGLLERQCSVTRSGPRLCRLLGDLALLARDRLSQPERAVQYLRQLLKVRSDDRDALQQLVDLYEQEGYWGEAANALIQLARLDKEPETLVPLFLRLGRLYQEKSPDIRRAIMSFRKVVALDPSNREALQRLIDLYVEDLDFAKALGAATRLLEEVDDRDERVRLLLETAKIHEDGLKDPHRAAIAYRQAIETKPTDLDAIGKVIGFFIRQGDQRSLMIHLDRSVATMRGLLRHNALDRFAHQALFKIFNWRKLPDGCFCAAQVLDALGQAGGEERTFLDSHVAAVGAPGSALADHDLDEVLFDRSIPGGFRHIFRLLADQFIKFFPGNIKAYGASRGDRVNDVDHPVRRIGDALAKEFGISSSYDVYVLKSRPTALVVENTSTPAILVGKALLHEATEAELQFMMGRSLWMISRAMVLPAFLKPDDLELLVAGIVRQYQPEFQPADVDPKALTDATKKVSRAIPRRLRQELMPFALECSGEDVALRRLGAAVVHSANRAGLLTSRSVYAGLSVLCRTSGLMGLPKDPQARVTALANNAEAAELLRFTVSDAHLELRRSMRVAVR